MSLKPHIGDSSDWNKQIGEIQGYQTEQAKNLTIYDMRLIA